MFFAKRNFMIKLILFYYLFIYQFFIDKKRWFDIELLRLVYNCFVQA